VATTWELLCAGAMGIIACVWCSCARGVLVGVNGLQAEGYGDGLGGFDWLAV
jgi:hypothetical protein